MGISEESVELVQASAVLVSTHSEMISKRTYEILFRDFPELKTMFKDADEQLHLKLAKVICAYALHPDNIESLQWAVEQMAQAHVCKEVRPEHYPMVGKSLIGAMYDVLGENISEKTLHAWIEAYDFLAQQLIQKEKALYASQE